MLVTKRKPASLGEILVQEFMDPMGLTQGVLAEAMGVQRKHVNELCNNRRAVTAAPALILARVFGNSPDFWLNVQRRTDLWEAMNNPRERERIERATPLGTAAGSLSPGRGRMLWRRNRQFRSRRFRAILPQCPDYTPAWAFCLTILHRAGALASHRPAAGARPSVVD